MASHTKSEKEMLEWEEEGDRVQWARAEAEMDRFQEQMELKLAEFLRCILSFQSNADIWMTMSSKIMDPGFPECARQTADMWTRLAHQCELHLAMASYKFVLAAEFNLVEYLEEARELHDAFLREHGLVPRDKRQEAVERREAEDLQHAKAAEAGNRRR
ncbi:hypothetical protein K438DRAFT_1986815 [Mycena galopus ATCC 62051]|nr:hypothetical protein K438DRAFT_1986815 [Mycena galopus ATCC 62051]